MTAGRGWIAVVAVMLGRSHPLYSAAACALFGFADAVGLRLQGQGLPNQLTDIAPYVATLWRWRSATDGGFAAFSSGRRQRRVETRTCAARRGAFVRSLVDLSDANRFGLEGGFALRG